MKTPPVQRSYSRATWFAARARNAARRGVQVAAFGTGAVLVALVIYVIVPREVDRAVRAQLDALPPMRDTAALLATAQAEQQRHRDAETALRNARRSDSIIVAMLARAAMQDTVTTASSGGTAVVASDVSRDAGTADLVQRLNRARAAPLVESYRELAQSPLLRSDSRVRPIIDSLEQVDREREAYAALGGPDARYAALSQRMNALGQRLIRLAENQVAQPAASSAQGAASPGVPDSSMGPQLPRRMSSEEMQALATSAASAEQEARRAEATVAEAREFNRDLEKRRSDIRNEADLQVPPVAMLLASVVLGVAAGFGGTMALEIRSPRVSDAAEAERLTDTRVITHLGAPDDAGRSRMRRRADRALPPSLDSVSESYHLLHLTLTGVGEVARRVRVQSDIPILSATVAANLAAVAARDARAVLLADFDLRHRHVASLLRIGDGAGLSDVLDGKAEVMEVVRDYPVGRDVFMTVLHGGRRAVKASAERRMVVHEDVDRLAARYDLAVAATDEGSPDGAQLFPAPDVILCAHAGVTTNAWLSRAAKSLPDQGLRLRAVVLWGADVPLAR